MMRAATKRLRVVRVMVTTMRVACNKEGDGDGAKSNGNKGVVQQEGSGNEGKSNSNKGGG